MPQRSLSEMANEQLRRKPREPFAQDVQSAGDIDCTKDAASQNAENKWGQANTQGLANIGPLLKRTIEEKCRK